MLQTLPILAVSTGKDPLPSPPQLQVTKIQDLFSIFQKSSTDNQGVSVLTVLIEKVTLIVR